MTFHRSDHDTMPGITMLVQGGSIDHIVPPAELQRLAEAYRAECHVFPGMAHDLMLDEGGEDPKPLLEWLLRVSEAGPSPSGAD